MFIQKRKIMANTDANVAPEASDLLFEAADVAELVAEVTGEPVEVTADENTVTFAVAGDEYIVEADGDEEILETSRRNFHGKKPVAASTQRKAGKSSKTIRKFPSKK